MTVLEALSNRLCAIDPGGMSRPEVEALQLHVIDTVNAMVVGRGSDEGAALMRFCLPVLGLPGARREAVLDSIAAHSAATRLTEIDDIHLPSGTTPAGIVVPAALVMAGATGAGPDRFAAACAAGIEAMCRLGRAVDGQSLVYKGIWTTYLAAPIGVATAAARLLGLDHGKTTHALAIALTGMAGRMGRPGTGRTSRWLMVGQAARAGAFAAYAAADGFLGDAGLLDDDWMEQAQGIALDRDALVAPGALALTELSVKPWCSAKQVIAAIAGLQQLLQRGVSVDEIDEIIVSVPETYRKMIDHGVDPGNRLSSVTSAPYQLALVAQVPEGLDDAYRTALVQTPQVMLLMGKVRVQADAALGKHLPWRWPARVAVTAGNRSEEVTVIDAPGDPGTGFGTAEMAGKFKRFAGPRLGEVGAERMLEAAGAATCNADALASLIRMLADPVRP